MEVLITGSDGFLGRNLLNFMNYKDINHFSLGIKSIDRDNHFRISSVADYSGIKKVLQTIRPDLIFHLAGSPIGNNEELNNLNFGFSKMLSLILKELHLVETKLILIGTSAEYGFIDETFLPLKENCATNPFTAYGRSKLKQTNYFMSGEASPINFMIIRPFNIYGPGMPDYLSISNFVNQIKLLSLDTLYEEKYLEVGNLEVKRDFLYIKDFVKILWELSLNDRAYNTIYNICSGKPLSLKKIVEYIIKLSEIDISIIQKNERLRKNDMNVHYGSNIKMLSMISEVKFTSWEMGIQEMFNEH